MSRHILAISGGGFSEIENAFIDDYLLKIKRKNGPIKIAFIATASHDAQGYIEKFYTAFQQEEPSHITIQDFELPTIQSVVNAFDILYVGGGNTQFMLNIWRKTGFDAILKNAYKNGVVLAGISAGALCWFEHCYSEKDDGTYEYFVGLGLLEGALCPHYNHPTRKQFFDQWALTINKIPLYRLEDHENLHYINEVCVSKIIT